MWPLREVGCFVLTLEDRPRRSVDEDKAGDEKEDAGSPVPPGEKRTGRDQHGGEEAPEGGRGEVGRKEGEAGEGLGQRDGHLLEETVSDDPFQLRARFADDDGKTAQIRARSRARDPEPAERRAAAKETVLEY
jgi:hypothetical protein